PASFTSRELPAAKTSTVPWLSLIPAGKSGCSAAAPPPARQLTQQAQPASYTKALNQRARTFWFVVKAELSTPHPGSWGTPRQKECEAEAVSP
ncbi:unnamed protein product, partial [Bubo scandiacus]